MRKRTLLKLMAIVMAAVMCAGFVACGSDDDEGFDYPMDLLYGKWKAVELEVNGKWYNVTHYPYTKFGMEITFYENGTFYGSGYLGYGSGTYKAVGKTITTYVDGKVYATYTVNSITDTKADLVLTMDSDLHMKVEKVK